MKEINGYLLVDEIPEGAKDFVISEILHDNYLYYNIGKPLDPDFKHMRLPKGNYSIIGLAKDLTEEQWKGIVKCMYPPNKSEEYPSGVWLNYHVAKSKYGGLNYNTATESGHSLLKANNLNPNTTLILRKIL